MTRLIKFNRSGHAIADWLNPEQICCINFADEYAGIEMTDDAYISVTIEEANRLIAEINYDLVMPSPMGQTIKNWEAMDIQRANATSFVDAHTLVHVDTMMLDSFYSKTAQSARRMWRCTSEEGISFNIFDHVDHRNTYKLFQDAGLATWMDEMQNGDTLDWSGTPIGVFLQQNGDFYNPVKIDELDTAGLEPMRITAESQSDD